MTSLVMQETKPYFSHDAMRDQLESFSLLYANRPIRDNTGGMKSPHMFLSWFTLRELQPTVIIESGVWKGQGTWFLEQACPHAQLYCLEPNGKGILYRSSSAIYLKKDFTEYEMTWNSHRKDDVVYFFDDHQNAVQRVRDARRMGCRHLLFEDNYPLGQGDCYSLKQALMRDGDDAAYLRDALEIYEELPPVFAVPTTRWGTGWHEHGSTPEPLLTKVEQPYQQLFLDEAQSYTWMCYARLKEPL